MPIYYSQTNQDYFIDTVILDKKTDGFFIDIGAHDGISINNSYFFEQNRNFNGLCIEPNPKVFQQLQKNRKCNIINACIAENEGKVKFLVIEGYAEMLSGIVDFYDTKHLQRIDRELKQHGGQKTEIEVDCIKLQNIEIVKNKTIDFCSIDTEGNEYSILKSIDFKKLNITCFTIENNYKNKDIRKIMTDNGYTLIQRLAVDDVFILQEKYTGAIKLRKLKFNIQRYWHKITKKKHSNIT